VINQRVFVAAHWVWTALGCWINLSR